MQRTGYYNSDQNEYAPLEELKGNNVFLRLRFKEFYHGRSANGALFVDSEGLAYKMMNKDFEKCLQTGKFGAQISRTTNTIPLSINAEFKVKNRSGIYFIEMVLDNV